jgi:hypothetical protein
LRECHFGHLNHAPASRELARGIIVGKMIFTTALDTKREKCCGTAFLNVDAFPTNMIIGIREAFAQM